MSSRREYEFQSVQNERGISMKCENESIKDIALVASGENRLVSSETKLISISQSHLLRERRCIKARSEDDSEVGGRVGFSHTFGDGVGVS